MQGSSLASLTPVASAAAFATGSATASERLSPFDRRAVTALLVLQLGLRIGLATQQRFNADEPQHYHVAWGWSRGLLPSRDLFDNHTQLFHLLALRSSSSSASTPRNGPCRPFFQWSRNERSAVG